MKPDDEYHKNMQNMFKKGKYSPIYQPPSQEQRFSPQQYQQPQQRSQQREISRTGKSLLGSAGYDYGFDFGDKYMSPMTVQPLKTVVQSQLQYSDCYFCFGQNYTETEFSEMSRLYFPKTMNASTPYYKSTSASQYERIFMKALFPTAHDKLFPALQRYCLSAPTIAGVTARIESSQDAQQQICKINEDFYQLEEFMKIVLEMDALYQKVGKVFSVKSCCNVLPVGVIQQNADLPIAK